MRMVEANGVRIATQAFGSPDDPAVVLIMGATASMLGWPEAFCHTLAGHGFHVIRFDHRDTGQSTTCPPGHSVYAVEDLADDVIGILDAYGLERAHLIGMSLGGYIGQMLALNFRERVRTLTLIASEPLGWDGPALPHISDEFLAHFAGLTELDWSNEAAVTQFLLTSERMSVSPSGQFDAVVVRDRIAEVLARTESPASIFNHAGLSVRDDWTGRFREISVPVLVLHGEDDPILPVENGRAIAAGIRGAEFVGYPGVGHELPASHLDVMTGAIADHLSRSGSSDR